MASLGINLVEAGQIALSAATTQPLLDLLIGRAIAAVNNKRPGAAYSDCFKIEHILSTSDHRDAWLDRRLLYTQLKAASSLRLFSAAKEHLAQCQRFGVHPALLDEFHTSVKQRLEETVGKFLDPISRTGTGHTSANFYGPIKVAASPVRGRTLITTRDVKMGELLLWEVGTIDKPGRNQSVLGVTTLHHDSVATDHDIDSPSWAVHHIMDDPSVGKAVHALCPDPDLSTSNLGVTDEDRISDFRQTSEVKLDLLCRQLKRNGFAHEGGFTLQGMISMISHSCIPNVHKLAFKSAGVSPKLGFELVFEIHM